MQHSITLAILAGGKATRMGRVGKAFVKVERKTNNSKNLRKPFELIYPSNQNHKHHKYRISDSVKYLPRHVE